MVSLLEVVPGGLREVVSTWPITVWVDDEKIYFI